MTTSQKTLTAAEMMIDMMQTHQKIASEGKASETGIQYHRGKAAALHQAHTILTDELKRLRHLFQNGALTVSDFNVF